MQIISRRLMLLSAGAITGMLIGLSVSLSKPEPDDEYAVSSDIRPSIVVGYDKEPNCSMFGKCTRNVYVLVDNIETVSFDVSQCNQYQIKIGIELPIDKVVYDDRIEYNLMAGSRDILLSESCF